MRARELSLTLVVATALLRGQSEPAKRLAFDVASVKPDKTDAPLQSNVPLGPGDVFAPNGGYFNATNVPLWNYIFFAYKLKGNAAQSLMPQLPEWVRSDRFDIQARASGNPGKDDLRQMMRSLLADRFSLAVHYETREVPVLAFVLVKPGKLGPQLRQHQDDAPCPTNPSAQPGQAPSPLTIAGGYPALCGGILGLPASVPGRMRIGARNVTLPFVADSLGAAPGQGRPLIDRTGLTGTFDFTLEWTPDRQGAQPPGADAAPDPSTALSFEEALREQLGIRLESRKGPVEMLIVDHIEHPSEN